MSSRRLAISSLLNEGAKQDAPRDDPADVGASNSNVTGLDALVHAATSASHMLPSAFAFDPSQPQSKRRRHSDTQHGHVAESIGQSAHHYRERERPMSMESTRPQLLNQYPDTRMLIDQYPRSMERSSSHESHVRSPVFPRPIQERILSPSHERMGQAIDSHRYTLPSPILSGSTREFVSPKLSAREFAKGEQDFRAARSADNRDQLRREQPSTSRHLPREHQFTASSLDRDHVIIGPRDHREKPLSTTPLSSNYIRDNNTSSSSRDLLREQLAREYQFLKEQHNASRDSLLSPQGHIVSSFTQIPERPSSLLSRESPKPFPQFSQPLVGPGATNQPQTTFARQSSSPFTREPTSLPPLSHETYQRDAISSTRQSPSPFVREGQSYPFPPSRDAYAQERYSRESCNNLHPPYPEHDAHRRSQSPSTKNDVDSPYLLRERSRSISCRDSLSPVYPSRDHQHPQAQQYIASPLPNRTNLHSASSEMSSFALPRQREPEAHEDPHSREPDTRSRVIDSFSLQDSRRSQEQHTRLLETDILPREDLRISDTQISASLPAPSASRPRVSPIHPTQFAHEVHSSRPLSSREQRQPISSRSTDITLSPQMSASPLPQPDYRHEQAPAYRHAWEERHEHKRKFLEEEGTHQHHLTARSRQPLVAEHAPLHHPPDIRTEDVALHSTHYPASTHQALLSPTHRHVPPPHDDSTSPELPPPSSRHVAAPGALKRSPPGSHEGRVHAHRKDKAVEMLDKEREKEHRSEREREKEVKIERPMSAVPQTPAVAQPAMTVADPVVSPLAKEEDMVMDVDVNLKASEPQPHVHDVPKLSQEPKSKKEKGAAKAKKEKDKVAREAKPKEKPNLRKKEQQTKDKDKEDAHDWFLEQFDDSPGSSASVYEPSRKTGKSKLREMTPVTDMDVDAELEETLLSRAPTPTENPMDVDVDSELLNLITTTSTPATPVPTPSSSVPTPSASSMAGGSLMPAGMVFAPPMRKAAMKKIDKDKDRESMPPPPPVVKKRGKPAAKPKRVAIEKKLTVVVEKKGKGRVTTVDRSRSTSAIPAEIEEEESKEIEKEKEEDRPIDDDRLYCLCRAKYDQDDTMVGCDRCDEWYHPNCVDMLDVPLDLVDQFICPTCIAKHPELNLKTTYKTRCLNGLEDPDRDIACPRPSRGPVSKYCSPECGVKNMRRRIETYTAKDGNKAELWEMVKDAERRDGRVATLGHGVIGKSRTKKERELEKLQVQLDGVVRQRDGVKRGMDIVLWREKLLELAMDRVEAKQDECGWDQRLCFGEEECDEFGEGVLENYGTEEEYWCSEPADCDRHSGWQEVRQDDIANEKEKQEEALIKLTTREREIRTQIEDLNEAPAPLKTNGKVVNGASGAGKRSNGRTKLSNKKK